MERAAADVSPGAGTAQDDFASADAGTDDLVRVAGAKRASNGQLAAALDLRALGERDCCGAGQHEFRAGARDDEHRVDRGGVADSHGAGERELARAGLAHSHAGINCRANGVSAGLGLEGGQRGTIHEGESAAHRGSDVLVGDQIVEGYAFDFDRSVEVNGGTSGYGVGEDRSVAYARNGVVPVGRVAPAPVVGAGPVVTGGSDGDVELSGQRAFQGFALGIGNGPSEDVNIAEVAVEGRPPVRAVASHSYAAVHGTLESSVVGAAGVRPLLVAVGVKSEITSRLDYQAEDGLLSVRNNVAGVALHIASGADDDFAGAAVDGEE